MKAVKVTDEEYAEQFTTLELQERHLLAIQEAMPVKGKLLLDIGCGNGSVLRHLERYKPISSGMDACLPVVEKAEKNTKSPIVWGDAKNMHFPDNYFDIVLCLDMIEHTLTPRETMSEIARVTRKGGKVILSTDGPYCKWSFRHGSKQQIENTPDPVTLAMSMSANGLKIRKLIGLGNTFATITSRNPLKRFIIRVGDKLVDFLYKLNVGWLFPNTLLIVAIKN